VFYHHHHHVVVVVVTISHFLSVVYYRTQSIDWVMTIEREQFEPYLSGYLGNTLEEAQQLQSKLQDFEPMAQVE
jgi:hypothetical protein